MITGSTSLYSDFVMNNNYDLMKFESNRLKSFLNTTLAQWSENFILPEDLSNAGFFNVKGERVQCVFCQGIIDNWVMGDKPLVKHALKFPFCPFILKFDVGNIKITGDDVCGNYLPFQKNIMSNGVKPHTKPKNPKFISIDARKLSFVTNCWNNKTPINVDNLAESGFFCIGMMDYVKCFHCNCGLCNWEKGDDPWIEHAKYNPDCEFVRLSKSIEFIEMFHPKIKNMENSGQVQPSSLLTDVKTSLLTDLNSTDDRLKCKLCYDSEICVVFLPCGHQLACIQCSSHCKKCPICRIYIIGTV